MRRKEVWPTPIPMSSNSLNVAPIRRLACRGQAPLLSAKKDSAVIRASDESRFPFTGPFSIFTLLSFDNVPFGARTNLAAECSEVPDERQRLPPHCSQPRRRRRELAHGPARLPRRR